MMGLINKIMGWGEWRLRTIMSDPLRGLQEWQKRGWNYRARVVTPIEGRGTLYFVRVGFFGRTEASGTARDDYEARWVVDDILAGEGMIRR